VGNSKEYKDFVDRYKKDTRPIYLSKVLNGMASVPRRRLTIPKEAQEALAS